MGKKYLVLISSLDSLLFITLPALTAPLVCEEDGCCLAALAKAAEEDGDGGMYCAMVIRSSHCKLFLFVDDVGVKGGGKDGCCCCVVCGSAIFSSAIAESTAEDGNGSVNCNVRVLGSYNGYLGLGVRNLLFFVL